MTREELDSMELIIRDLRMAMDIKADIESGNIRPIVSFADGEKITPIIPISVKDRIDAKIIELEELLNKFSEPKKL